MDKKEEFKNKVYKITLAQINEIVGYVSNKTPTGIGMPIVQFFQSLTANQPDAPEVESESAKSE